MTDTARSAGPPAETLRHVEGPSFLLDTAGDAIVDCNQRGARLLGYPRTELRETDISTVHPDDLGELCRTATAARRNGMAQTGQVTCLTKTGSEFPAEVSLLLPAGRSPREPDTDDPVVAVVHTDDEESRRTRQVGGLLRILRHTVRNRLNVVLGRLEMIAQTTDSERSERHTRVATEACEELLAAAANTWEVREVLGDTPGPDETVDLAALTRRAVETVEDETGTTGVERRLRPCRVVGTGTLGIAVRHLVENAVVHNDTEKPRVWVVLRPPEVLDHDCAELVVADDGPGLPAAERRIAQRETPPTPVAHNSGLGLWITAWIVRQSRGRLDIDTGPDGTVVTVTLPAEVETTDSRAAGD